jgi:hypothetical protein
MSLFLQDTRAAPKAPVAGHGCKMDRKFQSFIEDAVKSIA